MAAPRNESESILTDAYRVITARDVHDSPWLHQPLSSGDIFGSVTISHLSTPWAGPVIVIGHPCSLRSGLVLAPDIPIAPIVSKHLKTEARASAHRVFPLPRVPLLSESPDHAVDLTMATTLPATALDVRDRIGGLSHGGVIALQQRIIGNAARTRVATGTLAQHFQGPLAEITLWTDWRELAEEDGHEPDALDDAFEQFLRSVEPGHDLSWRDRLADDPTTRGTIGSAMGDFFSSRPHPWRRLT